MDIKDKVIRQLTAKNMCGYGVEEAKEASSIQDLINLLLTPKGIEFCMENSFPKMKDLLPIKEELLKNKVIVEGVYTVTNPGVILIYGGEVVIHVNGYSVADIYATNDAKVKVVAKENAYVSIRLHGDSKVEIERYDMSSIYKKQG